jgi:hypothetical protein
MTTKPMKQFFALALILTFLLPSIGSTLCSEVHQGMPDGGHHESHQMASQWTSGDSADACNGLMGCSVITLRTETTEQHISSISNSAILLPVPTTFQQVSIPPSTPPPKA